MVEVSESELNSKLDELEISQNNSISHALIEEKNSDPDFIDDEPRNVIIGMLSQFKKGMDLHKVPFPTFVLEPRSMLERITDFVSHPHLILK